MAAFLFWAALLWFVQPALDPDWPLRWPFAFLMPGVVYPVLEEIVFRGLLQDFLRRQTQSRMFGPLSVANLLTTLTFTVCHFFYHAPLWSALILLPSLVFGYFKDKYRNLGVPIALHVFYNAGYYYLFAAH